MRFFETATLAALVALASAQSQNIKVTKDPVGCSAGKPCSFEFSSTVSTPVTITLRKGISTDLKDVEVLSTSATPGVFTFTPKTDLAPGTDYAIKISTSTTDFNYSNQFSIVGGTGTTGSSSSTAPSSTSASASRSSTASGSTTASASTTGSSSAATTLSSSTSLSNSTVTHSSSQSSTRTSSPSSSTSSGSVVPTGAAVALQASSPIAMLVGAIAAVMYLN